jgi:glycosyltransferase involved in cell wall biosynthesis
MLDRLFAMKAKRFEPAHAAAAFGGEPGDLRPVVYLPTWVEWDSMKQRPQFLLEAFARAGHPVWFVDPRADGPSTVDGVQIVTSLSDVPKDQVILYLHFAPLASLFDDFTDSVIVYDILDDLSIYDADEVDVPEERRVRYHHPTVMDRADIVLVSNEILAQRHRDERPDLIHVPNGVDVDRFGAPVAAPRDVPVGGPIIGYHGMISHWFDFDLLAGVASLRPEWRFVLVGPTDRRVEDDARRLERLANVTRLGERSSTLMPAYVHAFDVGTIWFQIDDMTRGVTPLKMFEYLAAGVPCVSTPLPACVAQNGVATADQPEAFVDAIEAGLAADEAERARLREIATASDWSAVLAPALERLKALGRDRIA